ncbi:MAG: RNA 2',3'-cyclic phosphodiesterase [Rhodobacteraceae bacterium]|jgi:RNA 2',3'-cyclic 3'-phosphodiesterase|nr:RNA 2',3'-cyclic phosphodiesterase [Paracoccaceae bacterium]
MTRAFLALPLPDPVRNALAVQQFLLPLPRRVPVEDFHLTLCFLGDRVPDQTLQALHETLQTLRLPAIEITLQGIGHFGGAKPRAVYAAVQADPALDHVAAKLATAARRAGCTIPHTRFVPHVTLGRFNRLFPEDLPRLERAIVAGAAFRLAPFQVAEVTLFASTLGDPPRYDALATYPLG